MSRYSGKYDIIWFSESPVKFQTHQFTTDDVGAAKALVALIEANGDKAGVLFHPSVRMQTLKTTDTEWSDPEEALPLKD